MRELKGFIDEYGTNSLEIEKEGITSHFILSAVLIDRQKENKAKEILQSIREKYFQNSEIKSSKVKNDNPKRRIAILNAIKEIEFSIYAIVVDKKEINTKGLSIKKSFYKYFHKELTNDLNKINSIIEFSADEIGSAEFMEGFLKYLLNNTIQYNLFSPETKYRFSDSKHDDIIQLSDFIVGTLGKVFNTKEQHEEADTFLEIIKERLHVRFWPDKNENYQIKRNILASGFDIEISNLGLDLINHFIGKHNHDDEIIQSQIKILNYLKLMHRISPNRFVPTYELMRKINLDSKKILSIQDFRRKIIGNLRDNNVIVVSGQDGYKLPVNQNDVFEFINRYNGIIQPMIVRISKCRESILLRTIHNFDILDQPEYQNLKKMVDLIK